MALSIPSPITYLLSSPPFLLTMVILTTLVIILSSLIFYKNASTTTKATISNSVQPLPPSPPKLPIIGNLHQISTLLHRSLHSLSGRYGPLMLIYIGGTPALVVSSPSILREITKTYEDLISNRSSSKASYELFYHGRDILFAPYGEYWREMKRMCMIHYLSNKKVASYKQVRKEEVVIMLKEIERTMVVNMTDRFDTLSRDVICRTMIGESSKEKCSKFGFKSLLKESTNLIGEFYVGDYIPWLGKIVKVVNGFEERVRHAFEKSDKILEEIILEHKKELEERKQEEGNSDVVNECFLDVLLTLEEKSKSEGIAFDRQSVKAMIKDMLGAGTDTTSITMEWTMAELLRNPTTMEKLKQEIISIVGPNKEFITEEDLANMNYLKAILKEVLRLHPPGAMIERQKLTKNTPIRGYQIPQGTMLLINVWAIGRDPNLWDSPEEFRPERFINGEARDLGFNKHGFQLLAFGTGKRSCPGTQFSLILIELAIANLVYAFEWKTTKGKVEDIDMEEEYAFTTRKKETLFLIATKAVK